MKRKELKDYYDRADENEFKFRTWAEYSSNYVEAMAANGHRVAASKSAAGFSARFDVYNKKNVVKKAKTLEQA